MKEFFLDNFSSPGFPNGKESIIDLIANELLGSEQIPLTERRYYDMLLNFECVSHDAKILNLEGKDSIETQAKVYKYAIENRIRI